MIFDSKFQSWSMQYMVQKRSCSGPQKSISAWHHIDETTNYYLLFVKRKNYYL